MAAGGHRAPQTPPMFLERYGCMREARIQFLNHNYPVNHKFVCELYGQDKRTPLHTDILEIAHKDQAICSYDSVCGADDKKIFVAFTEDTLNMNQIMLIDGESRRSGPGGHITNTNDIYDYMDSHRVTYIRKHCTNPTAYTIKTTSTACASSVQELGMIQLMKPDCSRGNKPEVRVELCADTDNVVKVLILLFAVKLAFIEYKIDEFKPESGENIPALTSHFQSLSTDVAADQNPHRPIMRPQARHATSSVPFCGQQSPQGLSPTAAAICQLSINTPEAAVAYCRGFLDGYTAAMNLRQCQVPESQQPERPRGPAGWCPPSPSDNASSGPSAFRKYK
ncbi:hypothetical protein EB796_018478 [Bugula neritina]|uniref:Uncharacterized protein n=1 Tax=Bugula neritina TaxID=10212 RepID=A0A7J7JAF0_BUGNE|nr:hypothetical protein EB796_018478 [Bugula neritina]